MIKALFDRLNSKPFWIAFFALAIFVYFFGLTIPLIGPDEPRYSQVAREMFDRGDWVTTTLGGFNWFEKPALLYWLQISSFNLFGVNEFAARFGSAIFGIGTIFSLWMLGRTYREKPIKNMESFASWLALIAASTLGLIVFARGASFDIILTFPMTATMAAFFVFDRTGPEESKKRNLALAAFYFFMGVAVLAKGLVGFVFPFAIVAFYLILSWKFPSRALLVSLLWGMPLAIATSALWYFPMYLTNGWEFVDQFFIQHHFQRYTSNKYLHPQPFHFFFWVLPLMTIPWMPLFVAAVWKFVRQLGFGLSAKENETAATNWMELRPMVLFALAWMLVPLVFFSFSGSKLPGYILPAVPAAIVLTGIFAWQKVSMSKEWNAGLKILAVATLVVILGIVQFVLPGFADSDSVERLIREADDKGYSHSKVIGFTAVSHNTEFYAAGRLFRDPDGRQSRLNGPADVPKRIAESDGRPLLILTRPDLFKHLENADAFTIERIADNGELIIVAATLK